MIGDASTAKRVSELMYDFQLKIQESLEAVKRACPPEEYATYKEAIGKVASRIVFDVLEPLYDQHPNLKPPEWDD